MWTPDPSVGRRSSAAAGEERCKRSWAWVLEWFSRPNAAVWYHERRAVAHVSQDPTASPSATRRLLLPLPTCSEFLKKVNSRPLPTLEIEKQPRLPTLGPRVGRCNAQRRSPHQILLVNPTIKIMCFSSTLLSIRVSGLGVRT